MALPGGADDSGLAYEAERAARIAANRERMGERARGVEG